MPRASNKTSNARPDYAGAGVAGLTVDHWRRIVNDLATYEEVGAELGIKKQSIHNAFAIRGWTKAAWDERSRLLEIAEKDKSQSQRSSHHKPNKNPSTAGDAEDVSNFDYVTIPEAAKIHKNLGGVLLQTGVILAGELAESAKRERGTMSISGINAHLRAFRDLRETVMSMVAPPSWVTEQQEAIEVIESFEVSIMDHADAEQVRGGLRRGDDIDIDAGLIPAIAPERRRTEPPAEPPAPVVASSATPAVERLTVEGPLPAPADFKSWTFNVVNAKGRRFLREFANAVGVTHHPGEPAGDVIDRIIHALGGNPERLCEFVDLI